MNKRKPVDYTELYAQLNAALEGAATQMEQYAAIGKAVALRPEKGAAVTAADYLREARPELSGFSPRDRLDPQCADPGSGSDPGGTSLVSERRPAVWLDEGRPSGKAGEIRPFE